MPPAYLHFLGCQRPLKSMLALGTSNEIVSAFLEISFCNYSLCRLPSAIKKEFNFFHSLFSSLCHSTTHKNFNFFSVSPLSATLLLIQFSYFSVTLLCCLPLCHQFKFRYFQCLSSAVCHSAANSNFHFSVSLICCLPLCHQ